MTDHTERLKNEIEYYRNVETVHDLPEIFHYWSNKYLLPKFRKLGVEGVLDFYASYIISTCQKKPHEIVHIISFGSGNCDLEIELLILVKNKGFVNLLLECIDINPSMLERGKVAANSVGLESLMKFTMSDIQSWIPAQTDICIANQSLHHFTELEQLFEKIKIAIGDHGFFLTSDMIGRNGHMRWPEAMYYLDKNWRNLPDKYKFNHQLSRYELDFQNWDCSKEGFEGIRAQDILPLLVQFFNFDLFLAYNNNINILLDRSFGHNLDPQDPTDTSLVDDWASQDEELMSAGKIKPTQILAAMTGREIQKPKIIGEMTPEFCTREGPEYESDLLFEKFHLNFDTLLGDVTDDVIRASIVLDPALFQIINKEIVSKSIDSGIVSLREGSIFLCAITDFFDTACNTINDQLVAARGEHSGTSSTSCRLITLMEGDTEDIQLGHGKHFVFHMTEAQDCSFKLLGRPLLEIGGELNSVSIISSRTEEFLTVINSDSLLLKCIVVSIVPDEQSHAVIPDLVKGSTINSDPDGTFGIYPTEINGCGDSFFWIGPIARIRLLTVPNKHLTIAGLIPHGLYSQKRGSIFSVKVDGEAIYEAKQNLDLQFDIVVGKDFSYAEAIDVELTCDSTVVNTNDLRVLSIILSTLDFK